MTRMLPALCAALGFAFTSATHAAPGHDPTSFVDPCIPIEVAVPGIIGPAPGSLDRRFGCHGVRISGAPDSMPGSIVNWYGFAAALQADDRIIVVGKREVVIHNNSDTLVARYSVDGKLDTSFGTDGHRIINVSNTILAPEAAQAVMVQPDDSMVVVGFHSDEDGNRGYALRLNANGATDTGFGQLGSGIVELDEMEFATGVSGDGAGGYYVTGYGCSGIPKTCAARLTHLFHSGILDTGFGNGGTMLITFGTGSETSSAIASSNGRLAVVGINAFVISQGDLGAARFSLGAAGTAMPDTTFSSDGRLVHGMNGKGTVSALSLASDGSMSIAGSGTSGNVRSFSLTRIGAAGNVASTTFAKFPATTSGSMQALARIPFRYYGAGHVTGTNGETRLALAAFSPAGVLDDTFSADGMVTLKVPGSLHPGPMGVVVQSNDRIVVIGTSQKADGTRSIVLARFLP